MFDTPKMQARRRRKKNTGVPALKENRLFENITFMEMKMKILFIFFQK